MKEEFENVLKQSDFNNQGVRTGLIRMAKGMYAETYGVFLRDDVPSFDLKRIKTALDSMEEVNNRLNVIISGMDTAPDQETMKFIKKYTDQYENHTYDFLRFMSQALQDRNLGLKMKEKDWQIERIKKIFSVQNKFNNGYGIPISIEMELFARMCVQRVRNEYDNLFIVEADTGRGKTNFAWAAASTIASMLGISFSVRDNFLFNESRAYVDKLLRVMPFGTPLVFDEIGNQANSKTHWDIEQVTLMNDWRLVRFVGMSIFGCWTSKDELDKQLRSRINGMITIEERGMAHFRTFNKNRYSKVKEFLPYEIKNKIAYTSKEADDLIEEHDAFNHLDIPFYKIPDEYWQPYLEEKNKARTMKRAGAKWLGENVVSAQEHYARFMSQVPSDTSRVTKIMLIRYSNDSGFTLSMRQLVTKVAKDVGIKTGDLFVSNDNPADEWDGYFEVSDVIRGYIEKLKARLKSNDEGMGL